MEPSREVNRRLLPYEYQLGHSFQTAFNNINYAKGRQLVGRAMAYEWLTKFCLEDTDLGDQPRFERPLKDMEEKQLHVSALAKSSCFKAMQSHTLSRQTRKTLTDLDWEHLDIRCISQICLRPISISSDH
ncbi:hypothetical protein KIN20_019901 [Parelaphostrongylus tenuis]|uniref:Uncharacterized protein n=1 Tax=Parelaphostrongylus tenuis TaxID=148309 RepID=A0AAD5MQ77_PARTN|nr:hypothetical protein KIN20_019901 [Parelaphostrongylus tenuis]